MSVSSLDHLTVKNYRGLNAGRQELNALVALSHSWPFLLFYTLPVGMVALVLHGSGSPLGNSWQLSS